MTRLALALTLVALTATQPAMAEPHSFAKALRFEGGDFSLQGTGELKARALVATVTICDFAKYEARDSAQQVGSRLLVLRFGRKLSADQVRQVFRGVVEGHSGYTAAELESFLGLLPSVKTDSLVQFRADATTGKLAVFAASKPLGSVDAPQLAAALWAGLGTDS